MTRSSIEWINEIAGNAEKLRRALDKAERRLSEAIETKNSYYELMQDTEGILEIAFAQAMVNIPPLKGELSFQARQALKSSPEFSQTVLSEGLLRACNDDRVITAYRRGSSVVVNINMNKVAGTLEEYAKAVNYARKIISQERKGRGIENAQLATNMFYEKYFSVDVLGKSVKHPTTKKNVTERTRGKYRKTLYNRISQFENPAPWWKILNDGTFKIKLSSDRGGKLSEGEHSELITPPTRFVEKARKNINRELQELFNEYADRIWKQYYDIFNLAREAIKELERTIEELTRLLEDPHFFQVLEKLEKQLGERAERSDPKKLEQLARDISSGNEVYRRRIGGQVQIRTKRIVKEWQAELAKSKGES